jgi:hypothetical protein
MRREAVVIVSRRFPSFTTTNNDLGPSVTHDFLENRTGLVLMLSLPRVRVVCELLVANFI